MDELDFHDLYEIQSLNNKIKISGCTLSFRIYLSFQFPPIILQVITASKSERFFRPTIIVPPALLELTINTLYYIQ